MYTLTFVMTCLHYLSTECIYYREGVGYVEQGTVRQRSSGDLLFHRTHVILCGSPGELTAECDRELFVPLKPPLQGLQEASHPFITSTKVHSL